MTWNGKDLERAPCLNPFNPVERQISPGFFIPYYAEKFRLLMKSAMLLIAAYCCPADQRTNFLTENLRK
jgi:hypothetical protein